MKEFDARGATTKPEVFSEAHDLWQELMRHEHYRDKLAISMINRLTMCIENEGYYTKY